MIEEIAVYNQDVMAGRPATKAAPLFGQRLSALRKARGLTQRELAEALGTTREMVDYYERRAINPALEVVRGCAKGLNVPVIELLGSEDNNNGRKRRGTGPTGKMRRFSRLLLQLPGQQKSSPPSSSLRQSTRRAESPCRSLLITSAISSHSTHVGVFGSSKPLYGLERPSPSSS